MYVDETVIAGIVVVLATLLFFAGVARFIITDQKKHHEPAGSKIKRPGRMNT